MMQLLGRNQPVVAAAGTAAIGGVTISAVREAMDVIRQTREANLALELAINDHERSQTTPAPAPAIKTVSGRSGGRGRGSSSSMQPTNRKDLSRLPFNPLKVPRGVPKSVATMVWDVVKVNATINVSATAGTLNEMNYVWALNTHPQSSSWTALFDDYCIPQVSVTFQSEFPPGSTTQPATLYTAIDFDNNTSLGSVTALEDFATCVVVQMGQNRTQTRSVKPCIKLNSGSGTSSVVNRSWVDCAFPATAHNCIRSITVSNGTAYTILVIQTIWFAFRNNI